MVSTGQERIAELLIRKGADINVANDFGKTALHLAAQKGHDKIAELLVKHGANVHSLDSHGRTPLFWASFKGKKTYYTECIIK